jgi:hypothetical protein
MTRLLLASAVVALVAVGGTSAPVPKNLPHPLFQNVDSSLHPPKGLVETYAAFAEQAKKDGEVENFCLPLAVNIVAFRPDKAVHGEDISKGFLVQNFAAEVLTVRKVSDECYLIRTSTTTLSFIQTKSGEWKVYKYADRRMGC